MATNKHAIIRYRALDKCFGNFRRKYFMIDLIEACQKAIYEYTGKNTGISRRQIFDDIVYMESEEGWNIPLGRYKDGRKVYYRYDDSSFSINHQPISPIELEQLRDAIFLLGRLQGMPQFEWIYELLSRFEKTLNCKTDNSNIVCFQENPYLKGLHFFSDVFNAIVNKQVLNIQYQYFSKVTNHIIFHPYYLKQYNDRWFLLGHDSTEGGKYPLTNLALDRIEQIESIDEKYIEDPKIDFFEYFYDVVGVSIPLDAKKETISIKVEGRAINYLKTKPLHGSQKKIKDDGDCLILELNVIVNYEFETQLLTYADDVEVLSPIYLRENIRNRAKKIYNKNC